MADLTKEFQDNDILVVVFSENYQEKLFELIKEIEKQDEGICYISLNKPYPSLIGSFKKNNINVNKFLFVDAITCTVKRTKPEKNCIFISSPNALTELNIVITETIKSQNFKFLVFDSLSALLVYEKMLGVREFVHSVVNNLRIYKTKGAFIILKGDIDSTVMRDLRMFADKIVKID